MTKANHEKLALLNGEGARLAERNRRRARLLIVALVGSILALAAILTLAFYLGRQSRLELCNLANDDRATMTAVLQLARDFPRAPGTPEQEAARASFYTQALARTKPVDCGNLGRDDLQEPKPPPPTIPATTQP